MKKPIKELLIFVLILVSTASRCKKEPTPEEPIAEVPEEEVPKKIEFIIWKYRIYLYGRRTPCPPSE